MAEVFLYADSLLLSGLRKTAMVAVHQELNRLTGLGHSSWTRLGPRRSFVLSESAAASSSSQ